LEYRYPVTASTEAGLIPMVLKDFHLLPMSADYDTMAKSDEFAAIKQSLVDMKQQVEAQGGRFLLVYVPSKEHIYWSRIWDPTDVNHILERSVTVKLSEGDHGHFEWEPQYLSYDTFNANHNAQEKLLSDFTQSNGIEFLNLTPTFWNKPSSAVSCTTTPIHTGIKRATTWPRRRLRITSSRTDIKGPPGFQILGGLRLIHRKLPARQILTVDVNVHAVTARR